MGLIKESEGIYCDFTRQRVTPKTLEVRSAFLQASPSVAAHCAHAWAHSCARRRANRHGTRPARCTTPPFMLRPMPHMTRVQLLYNLADESNLRGKINAMFSGEHINSTEDRAVLHVATRAHRNQVRPKHVGHSSVMRPCVGF